MSSIFLFGFNKIFSFTIYKNIMPLEFQISKFIRNKTGGKTSTNGLVGGWKCDIFLFLRSYLFRKF